MTGQKVRKDFIAGLVHIHVAWIASEVLILHPDEQKWAKTKSNRIPENDPSINADSRVSRSDVHGKRRFQDIVGNALLGLGLQKREFVPAHTVSSTEDFKSYRSFYIVKTWTYFEIC